MKKLGIVAGGGKLPRRLIEQLKSKGYPYELVALKGNASVETTKGEKCIWIRLGEAGKGVHYFQENNVEEIVFIGSVKRPSLFDLCPDAFSRKFLSNIAFKAFGDDNLLRKVVSFIEKETGFSVVGIHDVMDEITAPVGVMGNVQPDEQALNDIEYGIKIAKGIGNLDIGQSVIIQQGIVLGVEAIEGTDNLIKRCKKLSRVGVGGVLIKIKKTHQEKRTDLPTVGIRTLINAKKSGLRGVAVQSHYTLVVDREELIKKADKLGLFVMGFEVRDE